MNHFTFTFLCDGDAQSTGIVEKSMTHSIKYTHKKPVLTLTHITSKSTWNDTVYFLCLFVCYLYTLGMKNVMYIAIVLSHNFETFHTTRILFVILCKSTTNHFLYIYSVFVCVFCSFYSVRCCWRWMEKVYYWKEWKKKLTNVLRFTKMQAKRKMISIIYNGLIAIEALKKRQRETEKKWVFKGSKHLISPIH